MGYAMLRRHLKKESGVTETKKTTKKPSTKKVSK